MPLLGTLTEDWSSGIDKVTKWSETYDPPTQAMPAAVVGGRARVYAVAGTHFAQIGTPFVYALASSQIAVEVPTVAAVTAGSTGDVHTALYLANQAQVAVGTRVGIVYRADASTLAFEVQTEYYDGAAITVAYDATAHRWWRIRASTTTLWFETSPDGSAWTIRRTATLPAYMVTATTVQATFEAWRDTGATDFAEIDNVNLTPATTGTTTGSLVDTFSGGVLDPGWTANGAALVAGGLHVNAIATGGVTVYSSAKSAGAYTFAGSQLLFEVPAMPRGDGSVNVQVWVNDPVPAATVDRIGFEWVGEQNRLDFLGQTGAAYTPIGTTASLTYDPVAHRWLRISHSGTNISWATSPDGLTWTSRRSLAGPPTWTTKTTLQVSFEAFRTTGTNDVLRIDNVNAPPNALATTAPSGVDALQRRTLAELDTWKGWLTTNSARGWLGEFGWVTLYGDAPAFNALGDQYLINADFLDVSATVWASGREWGNGYPLGVHVGTAVGDPLTIANAGASNVVAGHRTRGSGSSTRWRGVNLSGWEQGINVNGGGTVRSSAGYVHTTADFAFLAANGVDTVRLPLAWERLQPTLSTALDAAALTTLDGMLTAARQYGIRVVLDLHNYGRYTQAPGTTVVALGGTLTNAQLSDFWTRMSTWVRADASRNQTVIGYGLMNEPHDLTGAAATWQTASQAVVTAIRGGGDTRMLLVAGYAWSSLTGWTTSHPTGWITDTAANFCYEAHHYWDTTSVAADGVTAAARTGTYQQPKSGGGVEILTYARELAAATAGEGSNTPTVTSAGSFAGFFGI